MSDYLMHHGILGQKWGVRRYQNKDGSYTAAGRKRRKNGYASSLLDDFEVSEDNARRVNKDEWPDWGTSPTYARAAKIYKKYESVRSDEDKELERKVEMAKNEFRKLDDELEYRTVSVDTPSSELKKLQEKTEGAYNQYQNLRNERFTKLVLSSYGQQYMSSISDAEYKDGRDYFRRKKKAIHYNELR